MLIIQAMSATTTDLTQSRRIIIMQVLKTQVAGAFMTGSDTDGYRMNNVKLRFEDDSDKYSGRIRQA